jgi:hypothetical protein
MYFLRLVEFGEINPIILSFVGRRNRFQVERNVLLERQVLPRMHADLCGNFHHCWGLRTMLAIFPKEFTLSMGTEQAICCPDSLMH